MKLLVTNCPWRQFGCLKGTVSWYIVMSCAVSVIMVECISILVAIVFFISTVKSGFFGVFTVSKSLTGSCLGGGTVGAHQKY